MKMLILILTGVALSFPVMAENPMNLGKALKTRSLFKVADSNQDGKVSYAEHEAFIAMQVEKGRDRFKNMDLNLGLKLRIKFLKPISSITFLKKKL